LIGFESECHVYVIKPMDKGMMSFGLQNN
jgi:hypothetical protein